MRQLPSELQEANKAAIGQRSSKRKQVQKKETFTVQDSYQLTTRKESRARSDEKKTEKRARVKVGESSQRRCKQCNKTGHNTRTCKKDTEGTVE
jgi:hypothetical protein